MLTIQRSWQSCILYGKQQDLILHPEIQFLLIENVMSYKYEIGWYDDGLRDMHCVPWSDKQHALLPWSCYRGLYYTYIPVVSEAMTKCFENDRKSLLSVVLTKSLFTFLKMKVVLKRSWSESTGQGQSPMVQCIVISSWISLSIFHN